MTGPWRCYYKWLRTSLKMIFEPDVVASTCNPRTWEANAKEFRVLHLSGRQSEILALKRKKR